MNQNTESVEMVTPLRVLHVLGFLAHGGLETWLMDVVRNTSREELQVDVCVTSEIKGGYEEEFKSLGGRILSCPLNIKNPFSFYGRLRRLLSAEEYDVVHAHSYYFSGLILRAAAKTGVPRRIAHIHPAVDSKKHKPLRGLYACWMKRWIRRYGTGFVGPTKASLEGFWGPGWQEDPRRQVIYNGIRTDRFVLPLNRKKVCGELNIPENAPLVINVSRFVPHKRHEFLVQVAERVLASRPDVYFLLIGTGALKREIEEQVATRDMGSNFRFVSNAPSIDCYLMAADVFVFPSCNEGFGIAIIEAAAAGLKVIAQDIPGVREAAEACPNPTLLALETTAKQWAQALLNSLDQPRISENERQKRLRQFPFTIENSVARLKQIYCS